MLAFRAATIAGSSSVGLNGTISVPSSASGVALACSPLTVFGVLPALRSVPGAGSTGLTLSTSAGLVPGVDAGQDLDWRWTRIRHRQWVGCDGFCRRRFTHAQPRGHHRLKSAGLHDRILVPCLFDDVVPGVEQSQHGLRLT
jgi:hypothetical protein